MSNVPAACAAIISNILKTRAILQVFDNIHILGVMALRRAGDGNGSSQEQAAPGGSNLTLGSFTERPYMFSAPAEFERALIRENERARA